jgi:hypothetical protein
LERLPGRVLPTEAVRRAVFFSLMAGISIFTVMNAMQVFHPEWWLGWGSLALLFLFQYTIFHVFTRWRAQPDQ